MQRSEVSSTNLRDLYYTLCFYPPYPKQDSSLFSRLFRYGSGLRHFDPDFPQLFSKTATEIVSHLRNFDESSSTSFTKWMQTCSLTARIAECVSEVTLFHAKRGILPQTAQSFYALAQEIKRHRSIRQAIWQALPIPQQNLMHRIVPWTENPSRLSERIPFQWLGDGNFDRAENNGECLTDFGEGTLFRVFSPIKKNGQTVFPLAGNLNVDLVKTTHRPIPFLSSSLDMLELKKWGRIQELFDLSSIIQKVDQGEQGECCLNQFRTLASCYRAALCAVLDLPVSLPKAMGRQGEWTIWPNDIEPYLPDAPLTDRQLEDLHRFFALEKLWSIDLLGEGTDELKRCWSLSQGMLFQHGLMPLPTFFKGNTEKRHQSFLEQFNLDAASLVQWEAFEEAANKEREQAGRQFQLLQGLLERNQLSCEELKDPSPSLLRLVWLWTCFDLDQENNDEPCVIAEQLFSLLMPQTEQHPYNAAAAQLSRGADVTDRLLALKTKLKRSLAISALNMTGIKQTEEELLRSSLTEMRNACIETADKLLLTPIAALWEKECRLDIKQHLSLYCEEFTQEWEDLFSHPLTEKEQLAGRLLCLKKAAELPGSNLEAINQLLHSALHDAMVQKFSGLFLEDVQYALISHQD